MVDFAQLLSWERGEGEPVKGKWLGGAGGNKCYHSSGGLERVAMDTTCGRRKMLKLSDVRRDGNMRQRLRMNILNERLRFNGDMAHCRCREFN
jgi:hypothetical protein